MKRPKRKHHSAAKTIKRRLVELRVLREKITEQVAMARLNRDMFLAERFCSQLVNL